MKVIAWVWIKYVLVEYMSIMTETGWAILADLVLTVHVAFVLFIVGGLLLIWIGGVAGWRWIRNRWFRYLHLGAMGIVLIETLIGMICPLTEWEAALRHRAGQEAYGDATFMQYWLQRLLYWDWTPTTFTVVYASVFVAVLASIWLFPPSRSS